MSQMLHPIPRSHKLLYDDSQKNRQTQIGIVNAYVKDEDELDRIMPSTLLMRSIERKVTMFIYRSIDLKSMSYADSGL